MTEHPERTMHAITSMEIIKFGAPKKKGLYSAPDLILKVRAIVILGMLCGFTG